IPTWLNRPGTSSIGTRLDTESVVSGVMKMTSPGRTSLTVTVRLATTSNPPSRGVEGDGGSGGILAEHSTSYETICCGLRQVGRVGAGVGARAKVLGPVTMVRDAGTDVTSRSALLRTLLALLAFRASATVTTGEIVE